MIDRIGLHAVVEVCELTRRVDGLDVAPVAVDLADKPLPQELAVLVKAQDGFLVFRQMV